MHWYCLQWYGAVCQNAAKMATPDWILSTGDMHTQPAASKCSGCPSSIPTRPTEHEWSYRPGAIWNLTRSTGSCEITALQWTSQQRILLRAGEKSYRNIARGSWAWSGGNGPSQQRLWETRLKTTWAGFRLMQEGRWDTCLLLPVRRKCWMGWDIDPCIRARVNSRSWKMRCRSFTVRKRRASGIHIHSAHTSRLEAGNLGWANSVRASEAPACRMSWQIPRQLSLWKRPGTSYPPAHALSVAAPPPPILSPQQPSTSSAQSRG